MEQKAIVKVVSLGWWLRIGRIWVYKNRSDSGGRSDYILESLVLLVQTPQVLKRENGYRGEDEDCKRRVEWMKESSRYIVEWLWVRK
jgi:hypothetical protein